MAELRMTYSELQNRIEESMASSPVPGTIICGQEVPALPDSFEAAILTCLCLKPDNCATEDLHNDLRLWNEQIKSPVQLPMGNHNLIIQEIIFNIITTLIRKGTFAIVLRNAFGAIITPDDIISFGNELIKSLKKLDTCDICLAYKIVEHPSALFRSVSVDEITSWFPDGSHECPVICDMTHLEMRYTCEFYNYEDEICMINTRGCNRVGDSVKSLKEKSIAFPDTLDNNKYTFKW